jgi:hypothetical protein
MLPQETIYLVSIAQTLGDSSILPCQKLGYQLGRQRRGRHKSVAWLSQESPSRPLVAAGEPAAHRLEFWVDEGVLGSWLCECFDCLHALLAQQSIQYPRSGLDDLHMRWSAVGPDLSGPPIETTFAKSARSVLRYSTELRSQVEIGNDQKDLVAVEGVGG